MENGWLDAQTAAASLQITKATLYRLAREGRLPACKVGGRWRFRREAIERLFSTAQPVSAGSAQRGGTG